jgi:hypothetical protein
MLQFIVTKIKFSIEVLSPLNSDDDLISKKDLCEEYGVPEYWIVSPMSKKIWIYSLIDNKYELKHSCTLNDKFNAIRFEELEIDLSEVELICSNLSPSDFETTPGGNRIFHYAKHSNWSLRPDGTLRGFKIFHIQAV